MRARIPHAVVSLVALASLATPAAAQAQDPHYPDDYHTTLVSHLLDRRTRELTQLLEAWRSATGGAKQDLEVDIALLAAERRGYLKETMRRAPDRALTDLLSAADRADVDAIAPGNTAQPVTLQGELGVDVADDFHDEVAVVLYDLTDSAGQRYRLRPAGGFGQDVRSSMQVDVTGHLLDQDVMFEAGGPSFLVVGPGPWVEPSEEVKLLGLRCDFTDVLLPASVTPGTIEAKYNDPCPGGLPCRSVTDYYDEVSYGLIDVDMDVYESTAPSGKLDLGIVQTCDPIAIRDAALDALAADGGSVAGYYGIVIFADWDEGCMYDGFGSIGQRNFTVSGSSYFLAFVIMGNSLTSWKLNTHEIGHSLGAHHASTWTCNAGAPITHSSCEYQDYGDPLSVMGKGWGHWNAAHKLEVGDWFQPGNVAVVTGPAQYVLAPLSAQTSATQAIKISRGGGSYLYVEYRSPSGYDVNQLASTTNAALGASMYIMPEPRRTAMIDPHLASNPFQSALEVDDDPFTDPCTGVTLDVLSRTPTQLTVDVAVGWCNDFDDPTATFTSPASSGQVVSGTFTIVADASDPTSPIDRVEFFLGESGSPAHTDPTFPYEFVLDTTPLPNGNLDLRAVAYDLPGPECCQHFGTARTKVTVQNGTGGPPPVAVVTQPPTEVTLTLPFQAETAASDADGVAKVEYWFDPSYDDLCSVGEFHDGAHPPGCKYHAFFPAYSNWFPDLGAGRSAFLIGVADVAPYTWDVSALPPGDYTLWARAWDNLGNRADSVPITVGVQGQNPFTVTLDVDEGATLAPGASVAIPASTTSDDDEVGYVDFFVGDTLLCRDQSEPWSCTWQAPQTPGSYTIHAAAYGLGGRTDLDSVGVVVE